MARYTPEEIQRGEDKVELDKYDIALTKACATDDNRLVLTNVAYQGGKFKASDGFLLVMREASNPNSMDTMIPAKILKTIKTTEKKVANLTIDNRCQVTYTDAAGKEIESEPTVSFKPAAGTFPNTKTIMPKGQEKKATVALSVGLLKKMLSCLPNDGTLRIGLNGTTDPVEFHCGGFIDRPIYGAIMPMYIEWKGFKWQREE